MNKEAKSQTSCRTRRVWSIVIVLLLGVGGYFAYQTLRKPAAPDGPSYTDLEGRWVRPDGGYILELSDAGPDGQLTAHYFNPSPIQVSHAEWKFDQGYYRIFVVLNGANYQGSTYTMAFDPAGDQLTGIYFQALMQQQFEVTFDRTP